MLHLIAVLFVIVNVSNIQVSGIPNLIPLFDLMMIFYFTIFTQRFSFWFIFILGIWNDALNGLPLGITAFCYIILIKLFQTLNNHLLLKGDFNQVLRQFVTFLFLFLLLKWFLLSIFYTNLYNLKWPVIQLILSSVVYVPMHKFFDYLKEKLL